MNGKLLCGLLFSLLISGCSDSNTPTEKVLKEEFSNQFNGNLILNSINIEETSVDGNKRTYAANGLVSTSYDLYTPVASLDDYVVFKKSWDKSEKIKFSATLNSIGNKDTGWNTKFSSLQMSPSPKGNPIPDIEEYSKYINIDDKNFNDKIQSIKEEYSKKQSKIDELNNENKKIEANISAITNEISKYWGVGDDGEIQSRYSVRRELNKELELFNKERAPFYFKRKYDAEVYEPAIKARQEKLKSYKSSDFDDIRFERKTAIDNNDETYKIDYNKIDEKIKSEMKELDDGLEALKEKKRGLLDRQSEILNEISSLNYQYQNWLVFMEQLKKIK